MSIVYLTCYDKGFKIDTGTFTYKEKTALRDVLQQRNSYVPSCGHWHRYMIADPKGAVKTTSSECKFRACEYPNANLSFYQRTECYGFATVDETVKVGDSYYTKAELELAMKKLENISSVLLGETQ